MKYSKSFFIIMGIGLAIIVCIVALLVTMRIGDKNYEKYLNNSPVNQMGTHWVSEDGSIEFTAEYTLSHGTITLDGEKKDIAIILYVPKSIIPMLEIYYDDVENDNSEKIGYGKVDYYSKDEFKVDFSYLYNFGRSITTVFRKEG